MTYEEYRKSKCEWCAKYIRRAGIGDQWHALPMVTVANWPRCTAPNRDQFETEQARQIAELQKEKALEAKRLDFIEAYNEIHYHTETWGGRKRCCIEAVAGSAMEGSGWSLRDAIDAAMSQNAKEQA